MDSTIVTSGLRCAPEMGARTAIRAVSPKPVARLFASRASAAFPPDRRSAMIPEPTMVARSRPLPIASAAVRRARSVFKR